MIEYSNSNGVYSVSYQELREEYLRFTSMGDSDFLENLPAAMHFAVFCAWFKELPTQHICADDGIIHELAHLMHIGIEDPCMVDQLPRIRKAFEEVLELK